MGSQKTMHSPINDIQQEPVAPSSRKRAVLFLLSSFLIGVVFFVLLETCLSWFGLGDPELLPDPFVGFREVRPLFALNEDGSRYEIAPSRRTFFNFESFASTKASNEFRIFCLGGSTVAGRPYGIETSFTKWLELGLGAADSSHQWKTVNCGGISYASYRLVPILKEILAYGPDMVVVLTGHNEFIEDRTYKHIKHMPAAVAWAYDRISRLRTFTLLRSACDRLANHSEVRHPTGRATLPTEVQALLDYRGGLEKYHRDEEWRHNVIEHFRFNLKRMTQIARGAGLPLLLVTPGCNLRDSPPFKSQHKGGLSSEQKGEWQSLREEARSCYGPEPLRSIGLLQEATRIDDQHAGTFYELGKCYDAVGMTERAFDSYNQAKELDVCPLRIIDPMNQAILEAAREEDIPLVDACAILAKLSRDGIPGNDTYVDHVHPTIESHQVIANSILDELIRMGVVHPTEGWLERREEAYAQHLASLDRLYYALGNARLERLQAWAAGRCDFEPPGKQDGER